MHKYSNSLLSKEIHIGQTLPVKIINDTFIIFSILQWNYLFFFHLVNVKHFFILIWSTWMSLSYSRGWVSPILADLYFSSLTVRGWPASPWYSFWHYHFIWMFQKVVALLKTTLVATNTRDIARCNTLTFIKHFLIYLIYFLNEF